MHTDNPTTAQLIAGFIAGDTKASKTVFEKYRNLIYFIGLKFFSEEDCKDLESEIWLKITQKLREGKYEENGNFAGWLGTMIQNHCIDIVRKSNKVSRHVSLIHEGEANTPSLLDFLPSDNPNCEEEMLRSDTRRKLCSYIAKLPAKQQDVILLRIYSDLNFKEIAEYQNTSINTAVGRMRHALRNLRKMLTSDQLV